VQARTDLVPGDDFAFVRVEVTTPSGATVPIELASVQDRDWADGVRVAELADLAPGRYAVRVAALDAGEAVVVERPVRVELADRAEVVTVLLTRACADVTCPGPSDDADAIACEAGRCVPGDCYEEAPEACGDAACETVADCPGADGECGARECTPTGSCFVRLDPAACGAGACDPTGRCRDPACAPFAGARMAGGASNACVWGGGAAPFCWGRNNTLQFGPENPGDPLAPAAVHAGADHALVELSDTVLCSVDGAGALRCAGSDYNGEIGDGAPTESHSATLMATPLSDVTELSAYAQSACAVSGGRVRCWGRNDTGQLGVAPTDPETDALDPVEVGSGGWRAVSIGKDHGCAIADDRTLHCWGSNLAGQVGQPESDVFEPVQAVGSDADWIDVAVGNAVTCGIRDTSPTTAWCWGSGTRGEHGNGTIVGTQPAPQRVIGEGYRTIAATVSHVCAIDDAQRLWCWGWNVSGQVGVDSELEAIDQPRQVDPGRRWADVTVGFGHTCAIDVDGYAWCWGQNDRGQLGRPADDSLVVRAPLAVCAP